jgi:hypothetical protein
MIISLAYFDFGFQRYARFSATRIPARSSARLMRFTALIVRLLELMRNRKRADVAGLLRLVVHICSANFDLHLPAAELQ